MKRFEIPPTSRAYSHTECGTQTSVSGGDFFDLCNPLQAIWSAHCNCCRKEDKLDRFVWAETGEALDAYRQRLRKAMPLLFRWADSKWTIPLCFLFAAGGGWGAMLLLPESDLAWKLPGILALAYGGGVPFIADIWVSHAKLVSVI